MGGRNARGLSTKTGEIVDGRPEFEGAVHEKGRNRGREAEIREVIHENGRNRGWGTVYFTDQEPSPSVQAPSATM